MYYQECERCANKFPSYHSLIEKIDTNIFSLPDSSIILPDDISIKICEKKSNVSTILSCLSLERILIKHFFFKCPKCGNLIDEEEYYQSLLDEEQVECSQCLNNSSDFEFDKIIGYRINNSRVSCYKNSDISKICQDCDDSKILNNNTRSKTLINILHISDLHLKDNSQSEKYLTQLTLDLKTELDIKKIDYLIISGDVANTSIKSEYDSALFFLRKLSKEHNVEPKSIIIVPGNHDLNWDLSRKAYYVVQEEKKSSEREDLISIEGGYLTCNPDIYTDRFKFFCDFLSDQFFNTKYNPDYPLNSGIFKNDEDQILIIRLNSSWKIDHNYPDRSSIDMEDLSRVIQKCNDERYKNWLKIAVWHHPVTGQEMMNNEFLELLIVAGFELCLHGHIHEAIGSFQPYDDNRGIHIIGAGTFGAPSQNQVPGIPYQYNLISLDKEKGKIIINTRKKEHSDGAWFADARWGDKNAPKSYYSIKIKNWK